MINEPLYASMLNMLTSAVPSAFITLDEAGKIQDIRISRRDVSQLRYLIGKSFLKIITLLFGVNSTVLQMAHSDCIQQGKSVIINKLGHVTARGLQEYFTWYFTPVHGTNHHAAIYVHNITESVLIEEEFNSICEQYDAVNRELCVAMSNLDFQYMDLEQAHKKLAALYRITSVVQRTVSLNEVLDEIVTGLTQELGYVNAAILLLNEETQLLTMKAHKGYQNGTSIHISRGVIGYAVRHRELVYVPDVTKDPRYIQGSSYGYSEVAIPLIVDDKVIGVLDVETPEGRVIKNYDLDLLRSLASQIALTIAHAAHVSNVQVQAVTDSLTGLYNHRYFRSVLNQELKRSLRYERSIALLMIDIDNYKHYNDTHGHRMGDEVLKQVAELIRETVRDVDLTVRYGGEEFTVLCPETSISEAQIIAERIRHNIEIYPFFGESSQPGGQLTVSIGVAVYPCDASSPEELIDAADSALYVAKRLTKNCVCTFSTASICRREQ